MTYPLIGNYGRLRGRRPVRAAVAPRASSSPTRRPPSSTTPASSRRCCATTGIPAIAGVDTRALARHLRANGCLRGIVTAPGDDRTATRPSRAARAVPRWEDQDFVGQVSPAAVRDVGGRPGRRPAGRRSSTSGSRRTSSAALRRRGARVRVLPHTASRGGRAGAPTSTALVLSPGPGDPARLDGPGRARPRGHRRRPAAARDLPRPPDRGAARPAPRPTRLRFGHHGANHPVQDLDTGYVQVTAQNHEVQVVGDIAAARRRASGSASVNLNDGSVEGLRHAELPIETVQYHPEGAPGPARRARGVRPVRGRGRAARDDRRPAVGRGRRPAQARVAS